MRHAGITDADKTQRYLDTMHREALRLARLVDNGGQRARRERVRIDELLASMRGSDARVGPFVPFARSAESAAGSAPGVGLGLALCRRLARAMGADVRYTPNAPGAVFEIRLPRWRQSR